MASIAMMMVGVVVNALAFAGGKKLFSLWDKNGAPEEAKRHNAAMEKLNAEQADYNIKRAKNQDWLNTELSRKQEATNEIYSVNTPFDKYQKIFGQELWLPHPDLRAPELDYTPSDREKKYEKGFVGTATVAAVAAIAYFV